MMLDYDRCPETGRTVFFDCYTGRTAWWLPGWLAWSAPMVWRLTFRLARRWNPPNT